MKEIKTVGLVGLGAVGALYAERMISSGADLSVIVDEQRKARYAREGVYVNGVRVDFPYVTPNDAKPVDLLLIVTKEGGLLGAMETASGFIGEDTLIISLLNGVTSEGIVAQRFGEKNVLYSVAQGMDAVKEGNRLTYVHPGQIVLGEREPGEISVRVQMVADYLNAHGVKVTPVSDMVRRQWGKLMLNVGLNQACMVYECDYGGVQRPGEARETMLAAIKIGQVIFGIDQWSGIIITSIASIIYSALGGFRGAIYTDFFLFILIMVGAVVGRVYALGHPDVGGFSAMMSNPVVQKHLSFIPDVNNTDLFVAIFVIPIAIQWWNVWYPGSEPGGGGYIVQRMLSAKSENHCVGGSVLYQVINYAIRPWPWYLTAFASLIVFPDLASLQKAFPHINPALVKGDLAYPAMLTFVPNGWLGVVAASMMGALFSTVAAHLSMGSNYIANDFWKRFVNPNATEKELIVVGRWTVVALMVMTAGIAPLLSSAGAVFNLILQIGAGTGLIYLLRWFWMRINAWSEITAMAVSFVVAVFLQLVYPHLDLPALQSWHRLIIVMVITTAAWVGVTLLTPPTDAAKRAAFQNKIRANGHDIAWGMLAMSVACVAIYSMMFAVGYWIYGKTSMASVMTAISVVAGILLFPVLRNLNSKGDK